MLSPFGVKKEIPDSDVKLSVFHDKVFYDWTVYKNILQFSENVSYKLYLDTSIEERKAWWLIRSKLWRASYHEPKQRIMLCTEEEYDYVLQKLQQERQQKAQLLILEQELERAQSLNFTEKSLQTLVNIHIIRNRIPLFTVPYTLIPAYGSFIDNLGEDGMAYGADEQEAILIYEHLLSENYIKLIADGVPQHFSITSKGYLEVDKALRGHPEALKTGLFIRPYDSDKDAFFREVLRAVEQQTGCAIKAVWEMPHSQRMDERNFRNIKECAVILLDAASSTFNVGLEVGYALALQKPIILIREKTTASLPFDIATLNCYDYSFDNKQELIAVLSERVKVALETAKSNRL